jgi:hypothetical protein
LGMRKRDLTNNINMENKNQHPFWSATKKAAPTIYDSLLKWVDQYKIELKWDQLFAPGIKFHDLPIEMQVGVISKFLHEAGGNDKGTGLSDEILDRLVPLFLLLELRARIDAPEKTAEDAPKH